MQPRHPISTAALPSVCRPGCPRLQVCPGWGSPCHAAQAPSPLDGKRWARGEARAPRARGPPPEALPSPNHLHHWHLVSGAYSTSLSLTVSLYPQKKLKIADGVYIPTHHHHLVLSLTAGGDVRGGADSDRAALICQAWLEEGLSEPYSHVHHGSNGGPAPQYPSLGEFPYPLSRQGAR